MTQTDKLVHEATVLVARDFLSDVDAEPGAPIRSGPDGQPKISMCEVVQFARALDRAALPMTWDEAVAIARAAAKADQPSYYAEPFEPHMWVVKAILEAANRRAVP